MAVGKGQGASILLHSDLLWCQDTLSSESARTIDERYTDLRSGMCRGRRGGATGMR